jgi:cellulose synthase/poly-beta-1,6-N-acetylglucosamine synthase-like glycosyltransferase
MGGLFLLLAGLVFLVYAGLILAYYRAWRAIPVYRPKKQTPGTLITVLIPARNEEANIAGCLRSLALQTYGRDLFEVIVLDDHSADDTAKIVRSWTGDLRVRCLSMIDTPGAANTTAHKKFAIDAGVKAAAGELIVTTDADCVFHPGWLSMIAACYEDTGAAFIAAPVRIDISGRQSLLGVFQVLDFIALQGITGASVYRGWHSMCNGANLAYSSAAFHEAGGFTDIDRLPSGDDLFLMHKIARLHPDRVVYLRSPEAIVTTQPASRWKEFFHQRIRWASKADRYDDKRIFRVLLLVYIVNALLLVLLAGAFFDPRLGWLFLALLVLKTAVEYPFVRAVASFFGERPLMRYFILLQPLHILYTVAIGWMGKFGSYDWKDRKIKK